MFLQIHTLTSYPASLLNRDDAGLAKRIPFGNAIRLRVSSQCLKRHWREALVDMDQLESSIEGINLADGYRSRKIFELVRERIIQELGGPDANEKAQTLAQATLNVAITKAKKDNKGEDNDKKDKDDDGLVQKQAIYLSKPEVDYLVKLALKMPAVEPELKKILSLSEPEKKNDKLKKEKKAFRNALTTDENLEAMRKSARGLTSVLFGRMVTSDLLARVDAPVHVAHALTVQAANTEMDYFTVVDDLKHEDETGAAHINQTELGTGIYYNHIVVDIPLLLANLTGCDSKDWRTQDAATARAVLTALIHAIASQSPGAKLGSTAPYARAECVLLETGAQQPRTLANAYLDALKTKDGEPMQQAVNRMGNYLQRLDGMYGATADQRALATIHDATIFAQLTPQPLDTAIAASLDAVWS